MTELLCYWHFWLVYVVIVALLMSGFGLLVFLQFVAELICYTSGYLPWLPGCRPAL